MAILFLDFDECAEGTHKCSDNAECHNYNGTHNCSCRSGYEGDGFNCTGKQSVSYVLSFLL